MPAILRKEPLGVKLFVDRSQAIAVPEYYLVICFKFIEQFVARKIPAIAMGYRYFKALPPVLLMM